MTHNNRWGRLLSAPWFWFVVAFLIRMLYLLDEAGRSPLFFMPLLDEKEAVDSALEVLRGVVSSEPYFKAPGYSWIMAAIMAVSGDGWPWTVRAVQHLAGAGLVLMAVHLARWMSPAGRSRTLATVITGLAAACYAPLIRLETNLSLDFWVVFFQSAMLWTLAKATMGRPSSFRPGIFLLTGFLAALAWLTRPTLTAILPFLMIWIGISAWPGQRQNEKSTPRRATANDFPPAGIARWLRALLPVGLFILPVILVAVGVALRNQAVSSQPLVLPWQGGFSFYHANKPGATGRYFLQENLAETTDANPTRYLSLEGYRQSLLPAARDAFNTAPQYADVNRFWMEKSFAEIEVHPLAWSSLMSRKTVYLFSDKEIYNYEDFDLQRERSPLLRVMPFSFGPVFAAALISLLILCGLSPVRRRLVWLQWIYVVTLGGAIALYYVSGRMRMPLAFPLLALAGSGLATAIFHFSRRRQAVAGAVFIAGLIFSLGDWWGVRSESMAYADLARMSNAAWHRGHYADALELALDAETLAPDYPALPRLKAQALYGLGRLEESAAEFQKSVNVLGDETSRRNLGIVREELLLNPQKTSDGPRHP